jgi:hypothetical protein
MWLTLVTGMSQQDADNASRRRDLSATPHTLFAGHPFYLKDSQVFADQVDYPVAVASQDDVGVDAAINWCVERMQKGDTLTVWTSQKSNLRNNRTLESLVNGHSNVEHVTGRGGGTVVSKGPVLMAWADMDDIGKLVRFNAARIRALCVISWADDWLKPWVAAVNPTILGDGSAWEASTQELHPVVVEAMKDLTGSINHNNTIAAGYEKDNVVGTLLALRSARIPMDGEVMQAWALAHGWSGENPKHLAKYVNDINAGKRPQVRARLRADYINNLRQRAEATERRSD